MGIVQATREISKSILSMGLSWQESMKMRRYISLDSVFTLSFQSKYGRINAFSQTLLLTYP